MTRAELETVWAPRLLSVLRIVAAILFIEHGTQKLFGFPPPSRPQPEMFELTWFAGILETFGGFLLLIGLCTRPVAFVLSGLMAFAYWIAHAPQSPFPVLNGGEGAILFCFVFLYLAAAGPGALSLDGARGAVKGRNRMGRLQSIHTSGLVQPVSKPIVTGTTQSPMGG